MSKLTKQAVLVHVPGVAKTLGSMQISPETAFLLSRLDGKTDLATISFMSGLDLEKALQLLTPLFDLGVLKVIETVAHEKKVGSILDLLEHEENDPKYAKISRELRREVLLLFSRLAEMNYFEILAVEPKATAEQIKASYFALSKKYHPDRFFSEDVGHYHKKVSRIFEKINLAYETLNDQVKAKAYQQSLNEAAGKTTAKASVRENPMVANMNRARRYYQWGEEDYQRGNYVSAASNFLLAVNFDKHNEEYAKAYARVKPFIDRKRTAELMAKAMELIDIADYAAALGVLMKIEQSSAAIVTQDAEFLSKIARVGFLADLDVEKCSEYNRRAREVSGESAYLLITSGMILEKKNNPKAALTLYQKALVLEPGNLEADRAIKRLTKKK